MTEKRGRGRPRREMSELPENWYDIIVDLGKQGKTQVHIRKALGISQPLFDRWVKEEPEFAEAIADFREESAIYWTDLAQNFATGEGINQLSNANVLKYNILNRSYIGWTDRKEVSQETTVKADKSATDLFKALMESSD